MIKFIILLEKNIRLNRIYYFNYKNTFLIFNDSIILKLKKYFYNQKT